LLVFFYPLTNHDAISEVFLYDHSFHKLIILNKQKIMLSEFEF